MYLCIHVHACTLYIQYAAHTCPLGQWMQIHTNKEEHTEFRAQYSSWGSNWDYHGVRINCKRTYRYYVQLHIHRHVRNNVLYMYLYKLYTHVYRHIRIACCTYSYCALGGHLTTRHEGRSRTREMCLSETHQTRKGNTPPPTKMAHFLFIQEKVSCPRWNLNPHHCFSRPVLYH